MAKPLRWHRGSSGDYYLLMPDGTYYDVTRDWADPPGTDRRRQTWVLCHIDARGIADVISEWRRAKDAKNDALRHWAAR